MKRRNFMTAAAGTLGVLAMPSVLRAAPTVLKLSHYTPDTSKIFTDLIQPWARKVEEDSNGAIKVEIYGLTSAFGRADRQFDQVRNRVVDVAFGLPGSNRGRFPRTSAFELPFVVSSGKAGTRAIWDLYKQGDLAKEYDPLKVLVLTAQNGAAIHTVKKPVRKLEDLAGMRLRSPGPAINEMLKFLNASAVTLAPAQIYEALDKGTIDGLCTSWDLVAITRANEIVKHHTDCRLYASAFYFAMNPDSFAALPADLQKVIDDNSGDVLVPQAIAMWDSADKVGIESARKHNNEIIVIDDATREQWRTQLQPMIAAYLQNELKGHGVENPEALYAKVLDLVKKHSA